MDKTNGKFGKLCGSWSCVFGGGSACLSVRYGITGTLEGFCAGILGWISGEAERQSWAHHGGEQLITGYFGIWNYGSKMMLESKSQRRIKQAKVTKWKKIYLFMFWTGKCKQRHLQKPGNKILCSLTSKCSFRPLVLFCF